MKVRKGGVAFFDSGIGGLTVLAECEKFFSKEIFYYYGDHAHAPYGNLSNRKIKKYVFRAFRLFKKLRVKAVVVACNTATAVCIEPLRKKYKFPIIGTEPAVLSAAKKGGEVYVLSTRATFESERFQTLCKQASEAFPNASISAFPCDCLAGEIERNVENHNYDFTPFLPKGKPSSVVLGCTHYIYIGRQIKDFYGSEIYDGNRGIAMRLKAVLEKNRQKNWDERPPYKKRRGFLGFLTTFVSKKLPRKQKVIKANKCSCLISKKALKYKGKKENNTIFFFGENRRKDVKIYKRMFVFVAGGQKNPDQGQFVVKNPKKNSKKSKKITKNS